MKSKSSENGLSNRRNEYTVEHYNVVEDEFLYHCCHLTACALTGENANERNLITGTEYMNMEGMLPWECRVFQFAFIGQRKKLIKIQI